MTLNGKLISPSPSDLIPVRHPRAARYIKPVFDTAVEGGSGRGTGFLISANWLFIAAITGYLSKRPHLCCSLFIEGTSEPPYLCSMSDCEDTDIELLATWSLSPAVTLGSAVRAKGILQEIQARLPATARKAVVLDGNAIRLVMSAAEKTAFTRAAAIASSIVAEAEALPIIPREIQDILAITASERRRWLADGRLVSAGTRTVRLAGRARQITFHVFNPKVVEDLLDRGAVDEWRVEDAEATAEKRQRAAYETRLKRQSKKNEKAKSKAVTFVNEDTDHLSGWADFDRDGLLK